MLGRRQRRHPSLEVFAVSSRTDRNKTGGDTLRSFSSRRRPATKGVPRRGLVQLGGPCAIRPVVTGPAWPPCVTGLCCKSIPVITVCNPALWEYSWDNLGA
jgi:hypothetical protein